jgi:hypothetical protein
MESTDVIFAIIGGYGALNLWMLTEQIKTSKQISVLQKTVDELNMDVREFLRTELDALKDIAKEKQRQHNQNR